MKLWIKILSVFLFFSLIFLPKNIFAHPGNTAADGCHYCRTNCDKWGVPWNERHCHGGAIETIKPTSTPRPTVIPTKRPTIISTNTLTSTDTPTPTNTSTPEPTITSSSVKVLGTTTESKESTSSDSPLGNLAIFAWVVYGTVKLVKKIKTKT